MGIEKKFEEQLTESNGRKAYTLFIESALTDKPVGLLDSSLMQLERAKLAQSVKAMYSTHISQVMSSKMHSIVTPSMSKEQFGGLNLSATSGQDAFDKTQSIYKENLESRSYKFKRKTLDMFRAKVIKDMHNHILLPLAAIPDNGITKNVAFAIQKILIKRHSLVKKRKSENYTRHKDDVAAKLGDSEALRKSAKWSAKSISGIGADLQRNLYKFKVAARVLTERETALANRKLRSINSDKAISFTDIMQMKDDLAQFSISCCETEHYANKVADFCTALDLIVNDIKAHVDNVKEFVNVKKAIAIEEGDYFFK